MKFKIFSLLFSVCLFASPFSTSNKIEQKKVLSQRTKQAGKDYKTNTSNVNNLNVYVNDEQKFVMEFDLKKQLKQFSYNELKQKIPNIDLINDRNLYEIYMDKLINRPNRFSDVWESSYSLNNPFHYYLKSKKIKEDLTNYDIEQMSTTSLDYTLEGSTDYCYKTKTDYIYTEWEKDGNPFTSTSPNYAYKNELDKCELINIKTNRTDISKSFNWNLSSIGSQSRVYDNYLFKNGKITISNEVYRTIPNGETSYKITCKILKGETVKQSFVFYSNMPGTTQSYNLKDLILKNHSAYSFSGNTEVSFYGITINYRFERTNYSSSNKNNESININSIRSNTSNNCFSLNEPSKKEEFDYNYEYTYQRYKRDKIYDKLKSSYTYRETFKAIINLQKDYFVSESFGDDYRTPYIVYDGEKPLHYTSKYFFDDNYNSKKYSFIDKRNAYDKLIESWANGFLKENINANRGTIYNGMDYHNGAVEGLIYKIEDGVEIGVPWVASYVFNNGIKEINVLKQRKTIEEYKQALLSLYPYEEYVDEYVITADYSEKGVIEYSNDEGIFNNENSSYPIYKSYTVDPRLTTVNYLLYTDIRDNDYSVSTKTFNNQYTMQGYKEPGFYYDTWKKIGFELCDPSFESFLVTQKQEQNKDDYGIARYQFFKDLQTFYTSYGNISIKIKAEYSSITSYLAKIEDTYFENQYKVLDRKYITQKVEFIDQKPVINWINEFNPNNNEKNILYYNLDPNTMEPGKYKIVVADKYGKQQSFSFSIVNNDTQSNVELINTSDESFDLNIIPVLNQISEVNSIDIYKSDRTSLQYLENNYKFLPDGEKHLYGSSLLKSIKNPETSRISSSELGISNIYGTYVVKISDKYGRTNYIAFEYGKNLPVAEFKTKLTYLIEKGEEIPIQDLVTYHENIDSSLSYEFCDENGEKIENQNIFSLITKDGKTHLKANECGSMSIRIYSNLYPKAINIIYNFKVFDYGILIDENGEKISSYSNNYSLSFVGDNDQTQNKINLNRKKNANRNINGYDCSNKKSMIVHIYNEDLVTIEVDGRKVSNNEVISLDDGHNIKITEKFTSTLNGKEETKETYTYLNTTANGLKKENNNSNIESISSNDTTSNVESNNNDNTTLTKTSSNNIIIITVSSILSLLLIGGVTFFIIYRNNKKRKQTI